MAGHNDSTRTKAIRMAHTLWWLSTDPSLPPERREAQMKALTLQHGRAYLLAQEGIGEALADELLAWANEP